MLRRLGVAAATAAALFATLSGAAHAQTPPPGSTPPCQFRLGFAELARLVGPQVGKCLEDQHPTPAGDAEQRTSSGLMVWRAADNWTAYTDGYRTWINGPNGLEQRLNAQRFPWEPDAGAPGTTLVPPPAPLAPPPPAPVALAPGTELGLPVAGKTLQMTALSFERVPERGAFGPLVKVTVKLEPGTNTQHVGAYQYWDFRLRNAQGVEYRPSAYDQSRPGALSSGSMRTGQFVVGDVYFEVPAGTDGYGLHYYPSGSADPRVAIGRWLGSAA